MQSREAWVVGTGLVKNYTRCPQELWRKGGGYLPWSGGPIPGISRNRVGKSDQKLLRNSKRSRKDGESLLFVEEPWRSVMHRLWLRSPAGACVPWVVRVARVVALCPPAAPLCFLLQYFSETVSAVTPAEIGWRCTSCTFAAKLCVMPAKLNWCWSVTFC